MLALLFHEGILCGSGRKCGYHEGRRFEVHDGDIRGRLEMVIVRLRVAYCTRYTVLVA